MLLLFYFKYIYRRVREIVIVIVLVLMTYRHTNGQKVGFGSCPQYVTQTDFDLTLVILRYVNHKKTIF